jgi:hypothetical protein
MKRRRNLKERFELPPTEDERAEKEMYYLGYFIQRQGVRPIEPRVLIGPMKLSFLENTMKALINAIIACGTFEPQYDPLTDEFLAYVAEDIFCYTEIETRVVLMLDGTDAFALAVDGMVCSFMNMNPPNMRSGSRDEEESIEGKFESAALIPAAQTLIRQVEICLGLLDHSGIGWAFVDNPNVEDYLDQIRGV